MSQVFMIADMHFGHTNIIKYAERPFTNVVDMDEAITRNWNNVVRKEDTVFVLGDVGFYNQEVTEIKIKALNGRKILIPGNHDTKRSALWWKNVGFKEVIKYPIIYQDFYILSHEPVYLNASMPYVNIHGHLHENKLDGRGYFNVSVECIDYTPISFERIKELLEERMLEV